MDVGAEDIAQKASDAITADARELNEKREMIVERNRDIKKRLKAFVLATREKGDSCRSYRVKSSHFPGHAVSKPSGGI